MSGCSQKRNEPAPGNENKIEFNIDYSLLDSDVVNKENKFRFSPPREWKNISETQLKMATERLQEALKIVKNYSILPIYIFVDKESNSVLNVAEIILPKDKSDINYYEKCISGGPDSSNIRKARFEKDGIAIHQYMIQNDKNVNFKLFFLNRGKSIIQFDYIVPVKYYSSKIKQLESSIGSIKLI